MSRKEPVRKVDQTQSKVIERHWEGSQDTPAREVFEQEVITAETAPDLQRELRNRHRSPEDSRAHVVAGPSGTNEQGERPTANTGERDTVKEVNGS